MTENAKKVIVTTSWDDGSKFDMPLLDLLEKYNLRGTFYLRSRFKDSLAPGCQTLTDQQVRQIARQQEVGAHTIDHCHLTKVDLAEAKRQIIDSKKDLEDFLGLPIEMFCYPKGNYNQEIKKIVEQAGFTAARTVKEFCLTMPDDKFELGTALHIYPFPFRKKSKNQLHSFRYLLQPLQRKYKDISRLKLPLSSYFSWVGLAKNLFDYTCRHGGVFHLWGHSWEIEKYGLWDDLEKIFSYISNRENVEYLTNSQILKNT